MTLINDGAGNTLGSMGDKIIMNPLPLSGVEPGSFKPCVFAWLHLLRFAKRDPDNSYLEDEHGELILDEERLARLDSYQMAGLDLIKRFQAALNIAAELGINLGYCYAVHDDITLSDLLCGVEEMREAADAAEKHLREVFPSEYEAAVKSLDTSES